MSITGTPLATHASDIAQDPAHMDTAEADAPPTEFPHRSQFANDPLNLLAVDGPLNMRGSSATPAGPPEVTWTAAVWQIAPLGRRCLFLLNPSAQSDYDGARR
jgi:hypothetical protein